MNSIRHLKDMVLWLKFFVTLVLSPIYFVLMKRLVWLSRYFGVALNLYCTDKLLVSALQTPYMQ